MLDYGFTQYLLYYSLFTYLHDNTQLTIQIYVDDLVINGSSSELIHNFKEYLSSCFRIKDLGVLKYFLGIKVARNPSGIYLCQRKYALDNINEVCILGARPIAFPLDQNHCLVLYTSEDFLEPTRYGQLNVVWYTLM